LIRKSSWTARAIAASIERSVHEGRVRPSEALPPVRELARTLLVSPATVAAAYRLLRTRGLTAARGRGGTRVVARAHSRATSSPLVAAPGTVDLASGNPDPALLPALDAALRSIDPEPRLYDDPQHLPGLLQFVAGELAGDGVPAGAIACVGGGIDGIERVLREHLRPGDHVGVEDPGLPAIHDLMHASGFVAVPMSIDDEGPHPEAFAEALRKRCRAVVVTARAQNPCGAVLSDSRADELRATLRRHPDVLLVENDAYGPVAGAPLVTLCDSNRHHWAHVRSTSKFLGPDMRVAFVTGDSLTVDRVSARYALGPRRVSLLLQQLALALWSDPTSGRQLARASETYRQRRTALVDALVARGITAHGASGFNVWIPLRNELQVVHDMAAHGWAVAAGEPFRIRATPGIRITTATLLPTDAVRLADALAETLRRARRPPA
jgi:DNA-binding transcriptional MocR family regulator